MAFSLVLSQASATLAESKQPLVPERVFVSHHGAGEGPEGHTTQGLWGSLIELMVASQAGLPLNEATDAAEMRQTVERLAEDALQSLRESPPAA